MVAACRVALGGGAGPLQKPRRFSPLNGRSRVHATKGPCHASITALALAAAHGGDVTYVYHRALKGFAGHFAESEAEALRHTPGVAFVEKDGPVSIVTTQANATWGLDRISKRNLPLDSRYSYNATGAGVHAYIIDTGIRTSHAEFEGRASFDFDAVDGAFVDRNGHGTHVSGTIGGATYGVAKAVTLHGVRVLNCAGSGSFAGVIAGIDWVTANHLSPAVANMSLGGGFSVAVNLAVSNSIAAGTPPVADFTVACTPAFICTLDGSISTPVGAVVSWDWDLGKTPDPLASGAVQVVDYYQAASRTVTLTVRDANGRTGTVTKTFMVP